MDLTDQQTKMAEFSAALPVGLDIDWQPHGVPRGLQFQAQDFEPRTIVMWDSKESLWYAQVGGTRIDGDTLADVLADMATAALAWCVGEETKWTDRKLKVTLT